MAAPKQAFYLHYSESSFINPSPLTCFFFILVKDESRMASPQSQVTRQGFQGQKLPLQKRTNSAGCYMDYQEKAQLGSVDATQTSTESGNCLSSLRTADTVFPETPVLGVGKSEQLPINKVFFLLARPGTLLSQLFPFLSHK